MHSFDIDGVITVGIYPGPHDVIITGRSHEERDETYNMLNHMGIFNRVYFNPLPFHLKSRESSGHHKAKVINQLGITRHFEDDPVQADVIRESCPNCYVVMIQHNLTELENVRHTEWM